MDEDILHELDDVHIGTKMRGYDPTEVDALLERAGRVLADLRASGYVPELAVDDDPRNAEMYRSEGVPVVYVHSGYYDL